MTAKKLLSDLTKKPLEIFKDLQRKKIEVKKLYQNLLAQIKKRGYFLNPDQEVTLGLLEGLLTNEKRYGYQSCPCRLAAKNKKEDLDIICPCDYRDPDLAQYGTCFCGLYVSRDVIEGKKQISSIPERRPNKKEREVKRMKQEQSEKELNKKLDYPVWRCEVCGYICARDEPPEVCPICGVSKERFSRFI